MRCLWPVAITRWHLLTTCGTCRMISFKHILVCGSISHIYSHCIHRLLFIVLDASQKQVRFSDLAMMKSQLMDMAEGKSLMVEDRNEHSHWFWLNVRHDEVLMTLKSYWRLQYLIWGDGERVAPVTTRLYQLLMTMKSEFNQLLDFTAATGDLGPHTKSCVDFLLHMAYFQIQKTA